ncbi:hypothetical protein AAMO2058_001261100 [Amorphochlora amoebiformis]
MAPRTALPAAAAASLLFASVVLMGVAHRDPVLGSGVGQAGSLVRGTKMGFMGFRSAQRAAIRRVIAQVGGVAESGDRIKLHFRILSEEGEEITSSRVASEEPLMFTAGQGAMMPGIESNIIGMKVGEKKTVSVGPAEAFGEISEENIVKVPKEKLPAGADVGAVLRMGTQGFPVRVTAVDDSEATLDMNHPLAGKNLQFELEMIDAFEAPPQLTALSVETTQAGDGESFPKIGDTVTVHYTGSLLENGQVFDSSLEREPFQFIIGVGQVIRGWDEGVAQMSKGQKAVLKIPAALGYGQSGAGNVIPPGADLQFEVELIDIKAAE